MFRHGYYIKLSGLPREANFGGCVIARSVFEYTLGGLFGCTLTRLHTIDRICSRTVSIFQRMSVGSPNELPYNISRPQPPPEPPPIFQCACASDDVLELSSKLNQANIIILAQKLHIPSERHDYTKQHHNSPKSQQKGLDEYRQLKGTTPRSMFV